MSMTSVAYETNNNSSDQSLVDLAYNLRRLLEDNVRNHCSTIEVPKDKALNLAESIFNYARNIAHIEPYIYADNVLPVTTEDERVAVDTIERLVRNANSPNAVITKDEAVNLLNVFGLKHKLDGKS